MKRLLFLLTSGLLAIPSAHASLVSSLDFDQAIWTVTPFVTNNGGNLSTVSGGTITADKDGGNDGVGLVVTLNSPISTVGFQDLELRFTHAVTSGNLEWTSAPGTTVNQDGFSITSTEGISFITDDDIQGEATLDAGKSWTPANTPAGQGDLTFSAAVNNSSISSLSILVEVNANDETLSLSSFEIHGTPITSVIPEPSSSLLLLGLFSGFAAVHRKRRREGFPT